MANAASTVKIDSRKFLSCINDSAQSKIAFFEERVKEMGKSAKQNWRLVSLNTKELYFEDIDTNRYYVAEHTKDGRKINIGNIRQIEIVEEEKSNIFEESCLKLINAIEENDSKGMQLAFNRMKTQRFSSRVVPFSGYVRCKDNVLRRINISTGTIPEDTKSRLVGYIVEGLRDNVIVENGHVISGTFNDGNEVKLPVNKWATKKLVARRMSEAAKDAYWSQGFQARILQLANMIAEGKIEEAINTVTPFLDDMEEFTLLTRAQVQTLVENALAANAVFNQTLCDDTATLFYRTNMKISRRKIIDEWRNIARKSEHPALIENVQLLSEAKNFDLAYDKFLKSIFEAISNREVTAGALATTLEVLKDKTPKIRESHELSSKLDGLISKLKGQSFDDAAIYEAEDLIATIQEELAANESLHDFDQIPEVGSSDSEELGDLGNLGGAGGAAPTININSPLIQIGGTSGAGDTGAADEVEPELPEPPPEENNEEEEDLSSILGGGAGGVGNLGGGGPPGRGATPGMESVNRRGKRLNESRPNHYEMKNDADDDSAHGTDDRMDLDDLEESNDPYAFRAVNFNPASVREYGAPVITDGAQLRQVVNVMHHLAEEHGLSGKHLEDNLESMAEASIKAIGLRLPAGKMPQAIDEAIGLFESDKPFPGAAPLFGQSDDDDDDDDDNSEHDEGVAEDQFHGPRMPTRGYGRSGYKSTKIEWKQRESDGVLGEMAGVAFIFDHGGGNVEPVILSEDGSVEIPIPQHLYNSAFAAADMGDDDPTPFVEWLSGSLEQLRPITSDEDRALAEAMAKITTGPDGQISVEVSDDVDVDEFGAEDESGDDDENEFGAEDEEGFDDEEFEHEDEGPEMSAVDSVEAPEEETEHDEEDHIPDFESDEDMEFDEHEPEEGEEEEHFAFEDNDITEPQSSKYTKHAKENKRDVPTAKLPKKTDDKLEDIGPDLKKDDGTGTKPPTAKSMSQK